MKNKLLLLAALMLLGLATANAEISLKLADDITLRLGGDLRLRYEGFSSTVIMTELPRRHLHNMEYFRIRTRLLSALDFGEDITVNFSLANRFHYVTTSFSNPNNDGASTWEFPDEVYVDAANVVIRNLLVPELTLTVGRQSLMFGNGMLFAEGTPFDQGRSVYTDGITLGYATDTDRLTAFVLYDTWKDRTVFINDRNRALRSGDIFTAGLYETHNFCEAFNLDVYYMFNDVDDKQPDVAERAYPADSSTSIHTAGLRLFGTPLSFLDYSLEGARQFGRDADGGTLAGNMLDARLGFHLCDDCALKPRLGIEFTHFSGDDGMGGRNRSWNPVMSQCPLWGEELLPIMLNGIWSNLNMLGANLSCAFLEKGTVSLYATDYLADESDGAVGGHQPTGGDRHVGLLVGAMAAYKFNEHFAAQAYLSHFMPGDYFANGHDSNWFRLELTASF